MKANQTVFAELVVMGVAGTNFSFLSKIDLSAKESQRVKPPKKILPTNPGCCHVEYDPASGILHNCSYLISTKNKHANGFLCDTHQARVFPTYKLSPTELAEVNYRGTFEDQIILKDSRQIARDLEAGVVVRPRYGRFVKVQTEDEMMSEVMFEYGVEPDYWDDF